jgi:CRP/FNR family transcriptional regulator, cyclic AMP receptor protein
MLRSSARQDFLAQVPLFAGCSRRELAALARVAEVLDFGAGEVLMHEGDYGYEFLVVAEGQIEVVRGGRLVAKLGPGDYVGELALLDPGPRTATVRTTTPTTVVLLGAREFWSVVDSMPKLDRKLLAGLARRVREASSAKAL